MHAEEERRLRPDRPLVVGGARAVRRSDLDEARARPREHVGDAEAVADLDELAARDDHLASFRERGEREQHGGGVVVDDERGLGARQAPEERREVILPRARARLARGRTRGSSSRRRLRPRARARRPRAARGRGSCARARPSRSARVAATACARARARRGRRRRSRLVSTGLDLLARPLETRPRRGEDELARLGGQPLVAEQLVHRGQIAKLHAESVGTSSRSSAVSEPAAAAPTSSTVS